jgi:subtilase family serine protease
MAEQHPLANAWYKSSKSSRRRRTAERLRQLLRQRHRRSLIEQLEPRILLTGEPRIVAVTPGAITNQPIDALQLNLNEPVVAEDARQSSVYSLLDLGSDGLVGGGDDWSLDVTPSYEADGIQIELAINRDTSVSLARFVESDFHNGAAGTWTIEGETVKYSGASDRVSFFVSDTDMVDQALEGTVVVETTGDDDLIGLTTNFVTDPATGRPDSFYVLTWKQGSQGVAEEGLKLLRVSGGSSLSASEFTGAIWDGEDGEHFQVLASNLGADQGWQDNVEYEFSLRSHATGQIDITVRNTTDNSTVWQTSVTDPEPLPIGRAGLFNYSQSNTRYHLKSDSLWTGKYQLSVQSGDPGLRDADGNSLDGNADGTGGDDFLYDFTVDRVFPRVASVEYSVDQIVVAYADKEGVTAASAGDLSAYRLSESGGDGVLGNGNDVDRSARLSSVSFDAESAVATISVDPPLDDELYEFTVLASQIRDAAGNSLNGGVDDSTTLLPVLPDVQIDLVTVSDTGVSDTDNVTDDTTPSFEITVNKAGQIALDLDGDGSAEWNHSAPAAGVYSFTSAPLSDAVYPVRATFSPIIGPAVDATLDVAIDTQAPAILPSGAGGALEFDGVDDYVDLGAWSPGSQWTVAAWVKPTATPNGRHTIVGAAAESSDWGITLHNAQFGALIRPPGGGAQTVFSGINAVPGQWYHVAAASNGNQVSLLVDGQLVATADVDPDYVGTAAGVRIGGEVCCGGNNFVGQIDEVSIWDVARDRAEMNRDRMRRLTGSEPGLVGYWNSDSGAGEQLIDLSAAGHDGVLGGGMTDYQPQWVASSEAGIGTQLGTQRLLIGFDDVGGLNPASATNPSNYSLMSSGGDGTFDDGNEVDHSGKFDSIQYDQVGRVVTLLFDPPLSDEVYRVTIVGSSTITDLIGHPLEGGNDVVRELTLNSLPGTAEVDLQAGSDTGFMDSDNVTADNTPTVDVTVDRPGTIRVDFDGDGTFDQSQLVAAAGVYAFTAAEISDGEHAISVQLEGANGDITDAQLPIVIDTTGPWLASSAARGALLFDGQDDIASTAERTWGFSTTATISAWIKTGKSGGAILSLAHDAISDELLLIISDGKVGIYNHKSSGNYVGRVSESLVNNNEWVHVAGVIRGSGSAEDLQIFINGEQEVGQVVSAGTSSDITDDLPRSVSLGWRKNHEVAGEAFSGQMDEVRLWAQARTAEQIQNDMQRRLDGDEAGLVGYWNFDGDDDLVFSDASSSLADAVPGNGIEARRPLLTDSTAPIGGGIPTEQAPFFQRRVVANEPIVAASFTPDDTNLRAPGGVVVGAALDVSGSARSYTLTFSPQTASGVYHLDLGPDIRDIAGNLLDQDRDGVLGESQDDVYRDSFAAVSDSRGPRVERVSPTIQAGGSLESFRITFNEPIRASSLTAADLMVVVPGGSMLDSAELTVTPVSTNVAPGVDVVRHFDISFPAQATLGTYEVEVGPGIADISGNLMDQDGDAQTGEATDDVFQAEIELQSLTTLHGTLDTDTTWSGTVHIDGDLRLAVGATLTIQPGTVVKVDTGRYIDIDGVLNAIGTDTAPIVFTSTADDSVGGDLSGPGYSEASPGHWEALYLTEGDSGSTFQHVELRYAGNMANPGNPNYLTAALQISGKADVVLDHVLVSDANSTGVYLSGSINPALSSVTVTGALGSAFHSTLDVMPTMSDLRAEQNGGNHVLLDAGTLTGDHAWDFAGLPVHLRGDFRIADGQSLTIAPGTVVKMPTGAYFEAIGTLTAVGTSSQPIVFTSIYDDTVGGDSNGDGDLTTPRPGHWESLYLSPGGSGATLEQVQVRFGGNLANPGNGSYRTAAVQLLNKQQAVMTDVTVVDSDDRGVYLSGDATPQLTRVNVSRAHGSAFHATTGVDGNFENLSAAASGGNHILVNGGTLSADRTWDFGGLPVHLSGDFRLATEASLAIVPGSVIKMPTGAYFEVDGTFTAEGTESEPIIFTSTHDDQFGGDSNGNGDATLPQRGDWEALYLEAGAAGASLEHVEIWYAGNRSNPGNPSWRTAALQAVNKTDVAISQVTVREADSTGVWLAGDVSPQLSSVQVVGANGPAFAAALDVAPTLEALRAEATGGNHYQLAGGTLNADHEWNFGGLPVHLTSGFTLAADHTLTIAPGTVVKLPVAGYFDVNGTLLAQGTLNLPIVFTALTDDTAGGDSNADAAASAPVPGSWQALYLDTDGGGTVLDHVDIRYAGNRSNPGNPSWRTSALHITNGASTIRNTRVLHAESTGIYIAAGTPLLEQVHVEGVGSEVAFVELDAAPAFVGFSGTDNALNRIGMRNGTLSENRTWDTGGDLPIQLVGDFTVAADVTLTVAPGTVVKLPVSQGIWIRGSLDAVGTADRPIVFTSSDDDSFGGDSNGNGAETVPVPGGWEALYFTDSSAGSVLDHVQVRFAGNRSNPGNPSWRTSAFQVDGSSPVVRNTQVMFAESTGIYVAAGAPSFEAVHIQQSGNNAVYLELAANPTFVQLTGSDNPYGRIMISGGTLSADRTWDPGGAFPIQLNGEFQVADGATLTIAPGTVVKMPIAAAFGVSGTLVAAGTALQPIRFTAAADDTAGGNTNGDGVSQGVPGSWERLVFNATSTENVVQHVEVRYAGNRSNPGNSSWRNDAVELYTDVTASNFTVRDGELNGIRVRGGATLTLQDGLLIGNRGTALWVDDGTATVTDTGFFSGSAGVVVDDGSSATVTGSAFENFANYAAQQGGTNFANADFRGNWWGDAGGPHDPSGADGRQNINAAGQAVGDYVDYGDYLTSRPPLPVGPLVVEANPTRTNQLVTAIDITFSEPVDLLTFTPADISIIGPQAVAVDSIAIVEGNTYRATLAAPLAAEGTYAVSIGPGIRSDQSGFEMDQDRDGAAGEALDDQFTFDLVLDQTGPRVTMQSVTGTATTAVGYVDITFSEAIASGSFTPDDVTLLAPSIEGTQVAVQVLSVESLTADQYRLRFPVQFVDGDYSIEIGPDVLDSAGNAMDQNLDGIAGDGQADVYTGNWTIDRDPLRIVGQDPTGLHLGGIETIDVVFSVPIVAGTFGPNDVAVIGPSSPAVLDVTRLDSVTYRITTERISQEGEYTLHVGPEITDAAGIFMDQDEDNRPGEPDDRYVGTFAVGGVGASVLDHQPNADVAAPVTSIILEFNEAIQAASFSPVDVVLNGPTGGISITHITPRGASTFEVHFPPQDAEGVYEFQIGPFINDLTGVPMDQDGDNVNGEVTDDRYSGSFTVDNTGPTIVDYAPAGPVVAPFREMTVEFSEPMDAASFASADVILLDPSGQAVPVSVSSENDRRFVLTFASQNQPGEYGIRIGPAIADLVGNAMDESGDHVFGGTDDAFEFTLQLNLPDLVAEPTDVPSEMTSGESLQMEWLVHNIGGHVAKAPWLERVVLSVDDIYGNQDDLLIDVIQADADLEPNAAVVRSTTFEVPFNVTGSAFVLIRTDHSGQVLEGGGGPEENNLLSVPITIQGAPAPNDLQVDAISSPADALTGQVVDVAWRVLNAGTQATAIGDWSDRVFLSSDTTIGDDIPLGTFTHSGIVAAEASYTQNVSIMLPLDLAAGDYYLIVQADVLNELDEPTAEANNVSIGTLPIRVTLAPVADLIVSGVQLPAEGIAGQAVTVQWTVQNTGGVPVPDTGWTDRVYLSSDGTLDGAHLLAAFPAAQGLGVGEATARSEQVVLPNVSDGEYFLVVVTDVADEVFERDGEANNLTASVETIEMVHPDLVVTPDSVQLPAGGTSVSGQPVDIEWTVLNQGSGPAAGPWDDHFYLSTDEQLSSDDVLLHSLTHEGGLASQQQYSATTSLWIPDGVEGSYYILAVVDGGHQIDEAADESNNVGASPAIDITLAPYADLTVIAVFAESLIVGDPAEITVEWTVENQGTGEGLNAAWSDRIVLSRDTVFGNHDDILVGQFSHQGVLSPEAAYTSSQTVLLPPATTGRFHLFVQTDVDDEVFEHLDEATNLGSRFPVDVTPIEYADLVIDAVTPIGLAYSGDEFDVSWTVRNQGIGTTNGDRWMDRVYLSPNADGSSGQLLGNFNHIGYLAVGDTYTRTATVTLPDGLEDAYYLVVRTEGASSVSGVPYEFIYTDNNTAVSDAVQIQLSPPPDLVVADIVAPGTAEEGSAIDIGWSVTNSGEGDAAGSWTDQVMLREFGTNKTQLLGSFTFDGPLEPGKSYTRSEQFVLPQHISNQYEILVETDARNDVYEHDADGNNLTIDDDPLVVTIKARPNLQIAEIVAPDTVDAGSSFSAEFVVINQGAVPTTVAKWVDRVYLSLDDKVSSDDILISELSNEAALESGESYRSITGAVQVPKRYRGTAYVLVWADAGGQMDEWPLDNDNTLVREIYVEPWPFADLVISDVVSVAQAFEGAEVEVRYTVTNLGSGPTDVGQWTEQVWLTRDKNRPHPGAGDVLLASFNYDDGALDREAGYDQIRQVTLPPTLVSGTYYITPWVDPYSQVLEDTLATNVNPDDPNEIDNNNYKARAINLIGTPPTPIIPPDIAVTEVVSDNVAIAGASINVSWSVQNLGNGETRNSWLDRVYLSDQPERDAVGAHVWYLGDFWNPQSLRPGEQYLQQQTFQLNPAAMGKYVFVESTLGDDDTANNFNRSLELTIDRVIPDLQVTDVSTESDARSGELTTIGYTVANVSNDAIWAGTRYWTDEIWMSKDPTFLRNRATRLGEVRHSNLPPLGPGESYESEITTKLPNGIGGDYYVYVFAGVQNRSKPDAYSWPVDAGSNPGQLSHYEIHPFEDPTNNVRQAYLPVTYHEPDLQVTELAVASPVTSGATVDVTFTVTNVGTRETREAKWIDRVYLSDDPSLDNRDYLLRDESTLDQVVNAEQWRDQPLAPGASYQVTIPVTLPFGIEGDFYVLGFADSTVARSGYFASTIGTGLPGIYGGGPGRVQEFQGEGNNITAEAISVLPANPPDLQVTRIDVPDRVTRGQDFEVTYEVTNVSTGATAPLQTRWEDLIYLSRDEMLDLRADRYLGLVQHDGQLAGGESYEVTRVVTAPGDFVGTWHVFVISDPTRYSVTGQVYEGDHERNNDLSSDPLVIELPPPTDLAVTSIAVPSSGRSGEPVHIEWQVTNQSDVDATGSWSDAVYLSQDATWDINDRPLGRAAYNGTLLSGDSYTLTLDTTLPPVVPGDYRIIVRTDIFNQVYEDVDEANNRTASPETLNVAVDELQLGAAFAFNLRPGQDKLFQIMVPQDQTLRVSLTADRDDVANQVFLRYGAAPTSASFDATHDGPLTSSLAAIVPSTEPGRYYVLVRGFSGAAEGSRVTLLARLMPLSITNVATDVGGDSSYVTTTIEGAQFQDGAIVKLVRPGIAEYEPAAWEVINSTKIIATFDFSGAPHGLYDIKVINPNSQETIAPYRFLVERAIEPDVTVGVGGPRAIPAGDVGTFSVSLQNLSNLDAPYTFFQVGVPELNINPYVYGLPFHEFFTNVKGTPEGAIGTVNEDVGWVSIDSTTNTNGQLDASGFLYDQPADGFAGFSVNIATYPGLREMAERAFEAFRSRMEVHFPELDPLLADGPGGLENWWEAVKEAASEISPGFGPLLDDIDFLDLFESNVAVPGECEQLFIPYRFHIYASATSMTRDEYVTHQRQQALDLRDAIISSDDASASLLALAANEDVWADLYLAALEDAGLLLPDGEVPPIREQQHIVSLMATIASGILFGPAGGEIRSTGDLLGFFDQLRTWYGHEDNQLAQLDGMDGRDSLECAYGEIPVPSLPEFEDYNLGLTNPTHFEAFRIYVPWLPFENRGAGLPVDFQINGPQAVGGDEFQALDFSSLFETSGEVDRLASLTGPSTIETGGWLPAAQTLPYTINFENAEQASRYVSQIQVVTELDEDLDGRSFTLGDIKVGDITVHVPQGRSLYQGEFDFSEARGFILRVSAGVDLFSSTATWLLEAIDPLTGEILQDPNRGLLPPNDSLQLGAGFVSYTIETSQDVATGSEIVASARVLMNTMAPEDTATITQVVDGVAPASALTVTRISQDAADYDIQWSVADDDGGSGFKHVTLYVAVDGGNYQIWQRQLADATGSLVFSGEPGHSYEFLALASDLAGNRERPAFGIAATDDGSQVNLGATPTVPSTTPPNFGMAPEPAQTPSTNPLFVAAETQIANAQPATRPSEFDQVMQPFVGQAFATGIGQSHANIGPMAIAETPDGDLLISGGTNRGEIFRFSPGGGEAEESWVTLDEPVFNLAFDLEGNLWAVSGGGPLLRLSPDTGEVIGRFGDGLTIGLAVHPTTGMLYVGSNNGIEMFDPATGLFEHYSRDLDLRVAA